MKFLITGSLRSDRGPRALITLSLVLFLCFTLAHALREFGSTGFVPEAVAASLYGGPHRDLSFAEAPPGFIAILEDLHMDLFFFGLLALFLSSVLYQVRMRAAAKRALIYALFLFPLGHIAARALTFFFAGGAWLVTPAALGSYTTFAVAMLLILRDLYRAPPAPNGLQPDSENAPPP